MSRGEQRVVGRCAVAAPRRDWFSSCARDTPLRVPLGEAHRGDLSELVMPAEGLTSEEQRVVTPEKIDQGIRC